LSGWKRVPVDIDLDKGGDSGEGDVLESENEKR